MQNELNILKIFITEQERPSFWAGFHTLALGYVET